MKTALITGSMGQDGTYLTEHLLDLGYHVFGMVRRSSLTGMTIDKANWTAKTLAKGNIEFIYGDVTDELSIRAALRRAWPDEIYNLAGQVYVPLSWEMPERTFDVNTSGLARILKVVEQMKKDTRVYQASSSEMFGNHEGSCSDKTPMYPTSPYGISKYAAHKLVELYRDRGLYVVAGILFNHESPRRGHEMVTRKIARHVAEWACGSKEDLSLGSMHSKRDWGFAGDYVKAMHLMLQKDRPTDYVVGTGESYSVADFLEAARLEMHIDLDFVTKHTICDERLVRTQEIYDMVADNEKAKHVLGWEPTVGFRELVKMMVRAELETLDSKRKKVSI